MVWNKVIARKQTNTTELKSLEPEVKTSGLKKISAPNKKSAGKVSAKNAGFFSCCSSSSEKLKVSHKITYDFFLSLRDVNKFFLELFNNYYAVRHNGPAKSRVAFLALNQNTFHDVYRHINEQDKDEKVDKAHLIWDGMWYSYNNVNIGVRYKSTPVAMLYKLADSDALMNGPDLNSLISYDYSLYIERVKRFDPIGASDVRTSYFQDNGIVYAILDGGKNHRWIFNHAWVLANMQYGREFILYSKLTERTKMRASDINEYSALTKELSLIWDQGYYIYDISPLRFRDGCAFHFRTNQPKSQLQSLNLARTAFKNASCIDVFDYVSLFQNLLQSTKNAIYEIYKLRHSTVLDKQQDVKFEFLLISKIQTFCDQLSILTTNVSEPAIEGFYAVLKKWIVIVLKQLPQNELSVPQKRELDQLCANYLARKVTGIVACDKQFVEFVHAMVACITKSPINDTSLPLVKFSPEHSIFANDASASVMSAKSAVDKTDDKGSEFALAL